jgi:hypothetical protein
MLPAYFAPNQWARVIHYAAARDALESGSGCATCVDANLSLDGANGYDVVLVTPGYATGKRSSWADYIDDAQNRDGDDRYAMPLEQSAARDRIYAIRGSSR